MPASKSKNMDLTQGPVAKQLLLYTFPIFVSLLLQNLYSTVDQIVAGQFAGKDALAAIGSTNYSISLFLSLITGLATGANVLIANLRGGKNLTDSRKAVHASLVMSVVGGCGIGILGYLLTDPMLTWTGTPEGELFRQASLYMRIRFVGVPFSMIYNFGSAILRASGDTKRPMVIVSVSGIVNVVLNLFFVIAFGMGADGVAWATVASQVVTAVWVLLILANPKDEYKIKLREMKFYGRISGSIVQIGLPMGISTMLMSLSGVFLQSSINGFGPIIMAGSAAANTLTSLCAVVLSSFFQGTVTFSGQCFGAGKYKRLDQLFVWGNILCGIVSLVIAILCTVFARPLLYLVNTDPEVINAGVPKLLHIVWGYVLQGSAQIALGINRGMKKSLGPTCMSLFTLCLSRLLWIWFVFPLWPDNIHVLYFCLPLSMILNCLGHTVFYFIYRRKLPKETPAPATIN